MIHLTSGSEFVQNAIDAIGTTVAGKSIGLLGMVQAMRDKVDTVKTSGGITLVMVFSLMAAAFSFGGIYKMTTETRDFTKEQLAKMETVQIETKSEVNAQLAAIMDNSTQNLALMAGTFKDQLALSQQLFTSELEKRDIKLDIAYESASQGPRYTGADADEHEAEDLAHKIEADKRHYENRERFNVMERNCKDTRSKVEALEQLCEATRARIRTMEQGHVELGFHTNGEVKH